MPKKDFNQTAVRVPKLTTSGKFTLEPEKNAAAVALGKLGGLKGGKARAEQLSVQKRKEIAQRAALARWAKNKKTG